MKENALSVPLQFEVSAAFQEDIQLVVAEAETLAEVVDPPTAEAAVAVNAKAAKLIKAVGENRLNATRQLDAIKKRMMDHERNITKPLTEITAAIDSALNDYMLAVAREKARREAAAKAEADAIAAGETEERMTAPLVVAEPMLEAAIPTRKVARLLVTDRDAIPRKFFTLDERAVLKAIDEGETVPGAERVYEEVLVRR